MPLVSNELGSIYYEPVSTGPDALLDLAAFGPFPPTTIPEGGSFTSGILPGDGFKTFAIALTSSQAGSISVQRFLDAAGTIPVAAVNTQALTAAASPPNVLTITDGLPYLTFKVTITNTGGAAATVTNFAFIMSL
jgi:hypothetical protein